METESKRLPAEWEKQESVMVTYPHKNSDWICCLDEIKKSYKEIIKAISKYEKCLVICDDINLAKNELKEIANKNILLIQGKTNDTWIRDYGAIDMIYNNEIISYDFVFNGWGKKFDATLDNQINKILNEKNIFTNKMKSFDFVLEGGSIDSNGNGVLLTTSKCLLEKHRNPNKSKREIEKFLKDIFNLKQIIWLNHGYLKGDDTDSHIDTLARFLDEKTIAYIKCYDKQDEHYKELSLMEEELEQTNFNLIPLPMPSAKYYNNERVPATYLNFLFINNALLVPTYHDKKDKYIIDFFCSFYKNLDIIPIDSTILIREHGSIHCSTMNKKTKLKDIF